MIFRLTEEIADLKRQLESVRLALMETCQHIGLDVPLLYSGPEQVNSLSTKMSPGRARLGRPPLLALEDFTSRRDQLINFIEPQWPDLVAIVVRPSSLVGVLAGLEKVSGGSKQSWAYRHVKEHLVDLWEFLNSGRFRGEPRDVANALAGVPEMKWRTSLERGRKNPSNQQLAPSALAEHIKFRNPSLLQRLLSDGPTGDSLRLLSKCCSDCKAFSAKPETLLRILNQGFPSE